MHRLSGIFTLIILIFTTGCNNNYEETNDTITQDQAFLGYLEQAFNVSSTIEEEMFVIIPCIGCSGCEQYIYSEFTEQLIDNKSFTLIICNPAEKGFLSPTLTANNVKYDFSSIMSDYDFGYGYPSCIIVKDNIVVRRFVLSPDIIHWMAEFLMAQKVAQ
ncbi:MAG: hypothetical protein EOL88_09895 [Bacteroidia bacterium]|nr:hypothetical protein [Bacteroidales bacterium]MDD3011412.1 hypothetical protein [Bacteroidales bacterium]MDD3962762.1 hypothetical protein [Bacteroidales bacterium]MDY0285673.1 hypothetical protein [Bacteroidales bacterium]NCD42390.1 hypothetical protein [Bacteroidia bacterium]